MELLKDISKLKEFDFYWLNRTPTEIETTLELLRKRLANVSPEETFTEYHIPHIVLQTHGVFLLAFGKIFIILQFFQLVKEKPLSSSLCSCCFFLVYINIGKNCFLNLKKITKVFLVVHLHEKTFKSL